MMVWKLVWEKLLKVKAGFNSPVPYLASLWDPGLLYAKCKRNTKCFFLSVLSSSTLPHFKGTSGRNKNAFCSCLCLITSELQEITHLEMALPWKKVRFCATQPRNTRASCRVGPASPTPRLVFLGDSFENIILHYITVTITSCLNLGKTARAH